jgi:hypothetical protein
MWDLCNQYVAIADQSGLVPLIIFVTIIVLGFKYLGRARRLAADRKDRFLLWALSASLFANVVSFFGISYYDQTIIVWYALLAMIHAMLISVRKSRRENTLQTSDGLLATTLDSDSEGVEVPSVTAAVPVSGA